MFNTDIVFSAIPLYVVGLLLFFVFVVTYIFASVRMKRKWNKLFRKRSHAVVTGLVNEQIAPLLNEFPGTPSDARFLGKPIDYIIFEGLSQGDVSEIVFVEIKTNRKGRLTPNEKSVRAAIQEKRVRWVQYSLD